MKKIQILYALALLPITLQAQEALYIQGQVHLGLNNAEMGIFGDVLVAGTYSSQSAVLDTPSVYFKGQNWVNLAGTANLSPSTGSGAKFIFQNTLPQTLVGGSTGLTDENTYFPYLVLDNPSGLLLATDNAGVRSTMDFQQGKVLLNQHDFTVGTQSSKGNILHYNDAKYFVTNGTTANDTEGFVICYSNATATDYPIGTLSSYDPARIELTSGTDQQIKARVWAGAGKDAYGLMDITDLTCGKTWDIIPTTTAPQVNLTLAHPIGQEGVFYDAHRNNAFITHFAGTAPNNGGNVTSLSKWDRMSSGDPGVATTITTGTPLATHAQHTRSISSFSPFTKATTDDGGIFPIALLAFTANGIDNDVVLDWSTSLEVNNKGFKVEHSLDAENFDYIGFVKGNNAPSSYNFKHYNAQNGVHYYRLKQLDLDGAVHYSVMRSVLISETAEHLVLLYPNPTQDFVQIVGSTNNPLGEIQVFDNLGQILYTTQVDTENYTLDLSKYSPGSYVIMVEKVAHKVVRQ